MKKVFVLTATVLAVLNVAACVGKGKAPPPAAPVVAPVITKG
jgi:predicted small lipoprotein YifL